ncbi:MAG: 2-hydroxychromene-2-carboxylate isomerase [Herbaspirillum sp.]
MKKAIEFYFDFGSPTSYLAWTQLPQIAANAGAQLNYHPMLLGGVFQATGNHSPATILAKGRWMQQDMTRFAARYGVPFRQNPFFPINTMQLMRAAIGIQVRHPELFERYVATIFPAMWADGLDLGDLTVLMALLLKAGFDTQQIQALVQDQEVKDKLRTETEAAVARGVFGAPSMFVGEELFFGQDRLDFVKQALH